MLRQRGLMNLNRCVLDRAPVHPAWNGLAPAYLPRDLRERLEPGKLMAWVQQAVQELNWENPAVVAWLQRFPEDRPRLMLTLLSYAYLTRVEGSESVAYNCRTDRPLQALCQGSPPFADELTTFRRKNRRLLQFVMARVLERVLLERFEVPPRFTEASAVAGQAEQLASDRLDLARLMDDCDA